MSSYTGKRERFAPIVAFLPSFLFTVAGYPVHSQTEFALKLASPAGLLAPTDL